MKKSGVYKIINEITNNFYIGSSVNVERRKKEHFNLLRKNKHNNKHLQNSFNVYGEKNFQFVIVEYCNKEECVIKEQCFINELKPSYNINPNAGNSLGVKHTKKTIEKIRNCKIGKKHSEETKQKIGKTNSLKQKGENNSQYGSIWITNGIENKKIKKDSEIPQGWYKGRKQ